MNRPASALREQPAPGGRARAVGVLVLSLLVLSPNLVLLWRSRDLPFAIGVCAQAVFLWAMAVAALRRWRWLMWASLPLLLLAPVEIFFIHTYGYPSSRHVFALVSETNAAEASEFLSGLVWLIAVGLVTVLAAWWGLWRRVPDGALVGWRWQAFALAGLFAVTIGHDLLRRVPSVPLAVRQFTWANAYPVGGLYRVAGFLRFRQQDAKARAAVERHRWNAHAPAGPMVLVVVIGESARPDHFGLGGYARDTTPRLKATDGVVFLPHLVTPWPLTRFAVPVLLTRKSATDAGVLPEKSFIAAYREAGFQTFWLANQDGLQEVSLHVPEAEFKKSFNLAVGRGDVDAVPDGAMLPDVAAALERPGDRKLLVVHTKGNHWDYHLRYPPEFARFQPDRLPDGSSGKYDPANRAVLVNAYDNAIRYTDHVLAELIGQLERHGGDAALVYVSDHGQGLYDGACTMFGHASDLEAAFRTAGLVWVSSSWRAHHPAAWSALQANGGKPWSTAQTVFHTVAGLGGLDISDPAHSLLSPSARPDPRLVNTSRGPADFDTARRDGACRLLSP